MAFLAAVAASGYTSGGCSVAFDCGVDNAAVFNKTVAAAGDGGDG